jgi:serine/threonine protein kinase
MELPQDPAIGREVDGYRIEEVLGRGGMGVVYKAEEVALARSVALKRIDPGRAGDETFLRRFRSEAQALARINSPYITRIYSLRKTELGPLIVMEYVEGGTLGELLREAGPMDEPAARSLIDQMLRALEDAHGAEVIHRDIKPNNVLLTSERAVKLTDFGLAKALQRDPQSTVTQGAAGTLNYMSPEQVQGQNNLGPSSDLFSLGMVAYELLAGRLPFDRDSSNFAKMRAIVEEPFAPPSQFHAEAPADLAGIVMKALDKDPDERFPSASAMREALGEGGGAAKPAGALPASASGEAAGATQTSEVPSGARRTWPKVLAGVLALVLLAGSGYGLWKNGAWGVFEHEPFEHHEHHDGPDSSAASEGPATDSSAAGAADSSSRRAQLTIETTPPEAQVYLDERSVGSTPLQNHSVESGSLKVRLETPDRPAVDTLLRPEAGQSLALRLSLPAAPVDSADSASADSASAEAPSPEEDAPEPPTGENNEETEPAPDAAPDSTDQSTEANDGSPATLTVNVEPRGSVEWNGKRHEGGSTFQVPPGWRTLQLHHPEYETEEEYVKLDAGQSAIRVFHFKRTVRVKTDGPSGQIWVDGRETDHTTPGALTLGPGRYKIRVRVPEHTVSGGKLVYHSSDLDEEIEFDKGNTKSVFFQPAFQKTACELVFHTREIE